VWEDRDSDVLKKVGFESALSSPVAFYHSGRAVWAVVHGDDFAFTGVDADLGFAVQELMKQY
jgi:hypothetical protein